MVLCSNLASNFLSGTAPGNFTSPEIATPAGTYAINDNYFAPSPVAYAAGAPFCPSDPQGA